jgi:hypothetical protein
MNRIRQLRCGVAFMSADGVRATRMQQALNPRVPVYDTSRKDPHWGKRKLVRDR